MSIRPLHRLSSRRFESAAILRKLAAASRKLAELKGVVASIPNEGILINTLGLQEAKDSSAIENIVTTHDELFRDVASAGTEAAPAKEVARYSAALHEGFKLVSKQELLTTNHILKVQEVLEPEKAGFRRNPVG